MAFFARFLFAIGNEYLMYIHFCAVCMKTMGVIWKYQFNINEIVFKNQKSIDFLLDKWYNLCIKK